jgi:hypothetical protein
MPQTVTLLPCQLSVSESLAEATKCGEIDSFYKLQHLICKVYIGLSWWQRGLMRRSAAARLLGFAGSNPAGGMGVCLLWLLCIVR